jgi:hydroxymethylglutaryl-CoA lyase
MNLPKQANITEVGPRDGLQNIKAWIPTETKLAIIDGLVDAGLKKIEVTSFVHPKAIPQMADAATVLQTAKQKHGGKIVFVALAPNLVGAVNAIEAGADELTFVVSASERHNEENTRQTIDESLTGLAKVCKLDPKRLVRLVVATSFVCPFAGVVEPSKVAYVIEAGLKAGAKEVALGDTVGKAHPLQVESLLNYLMPRFPGVDFILHLHDTCGMGLASIITALQMGITNYEASVGGLGGCPFAPGAAGNIATEDLVNMLHAVNIETGIDLPKLVSVARMIDAVIPLSVNGHMVKVL